MKFNTRTRSGASVVNLTPLIDCMFLLVIFIMIAARFEPEGGIPVDLPKAAAGEAKKIEAINLTVTADGRVYLEQDEVPVEELEARLIAARTAKGDPEGNEVVLVVHGDKEAPHGAVVAALDAAARAKQQKVTIRTRQ
ncbi:MAG: biopolymer transporter ExbD [Planctomycetota bacterium]|jgi:biopolymer transport protein ExbD|nr:biopolymer transporter ExbD [Planctomycetota bacterium]